MPSLRFPTRPVYLIGVAAVLHLIVALAIFLVGYFQLLPRAIDAHGLGFSFAVDGLTYRSLAIDLADILRSNGVLAWLATPVPLHARLYSLSFALVGKLLGYNILAAEPLNLLYYLGIVTVVYLIGRELFNSRAALIAAAIVGVWPSFLVHSVQMIRDPLSILCLLVLLCVMTVLLRRDFSWRRGLLVGLGVALLVTVFWLARGNMWNVAVALVALAILLLIIRMIGERKFFAGNWISMALLVAAIVFVPSNIESPALPGVQQPTTAFASPAPLPNATHGIIPRLIKQITGRRTGVPNPNLASGSNIDANVRLDNASDIVKYIPRAAVIGFFAPFPNMWLGRTGVAGGAARILSGTEMVILYLLYVPAAICLWQERRNLAMWLTALVAIISLTALGLVVINAGALYRLRYAFVIMLIILAAQGILIVAPRLAHGGVRRN